MIGYFFVALTILLTVYGQLIIKWQVIRAGALPEDLAGRMHFMFHLLLNPWIISGLGAAFVASLCWMLALTKLPLSQAYPFTAASFVFVVIGGAWLFSEPLSIQRIIALVLIGAGVVLVGLE
jgi:multidrug transporter EmrE-like cation transporter